MDPRAWFFRILLFVSFPYVFLTVYRYTSGLFRRV